MAIHPVTDIFSLPPESGISILAREPFRAITATDKAGQIRRRPPIRILQPCGNCLDENAFLGADLYEPISVFAYSATDSILVGERAIVTRNEAYLVTDSDHVRHTPAIFHEEPRRKFEFTKLDEVSDGFVISKTQLPEQVIKGPLVTLTAMEQGNYGAFLLRSLPKLILTRQIGLLSHPILCANLPWQRDMLALAEVSLDNIVPFDPSLLYKVEELIVPSMRTSEFFLDDGAINFFMALAERARALTKLKSNPEWVYVSRLSRGRENPNYRHFVNEQELIDSLGPLGFYIFEPERHSIAEQIAVFSQAKFVVGPGGAGMFNTVFCRPGTTVISLEPMLHWIGLHANIFASMGHRYALVVGGTDETDQTIQKRWHTDIAAVIALVHELAP